MLGDKLMNCSFHHWR